MFLSNNNCVLGKRSQHTETIIMKEMRLNVTLHSQLLLSRTIPKNFVCHSHKYIYLLSSKLVHMVAIWLFVFEVHGPTSLLDQGTQVVLFRAEREIPPKKSFPVSSAAVVVMFCHLFCSASFQPKSFCPIVPGFLFFSLRKPKPQNRAVIVVQ